MLCALYAITALGWWLLIRYAADRWWPATVLLYAPRWPLFVPLLVLLPWAWRRRRRLAWLPLLTGLFVLFPVLNFNVPWHRLTGTPPRGFKLRVLTCNLHRIELDASRLDEYLKSAHADIIAFQDYSNWDEMPSLNDGGWHVYQIGNQLFVASRYPIRRVHDLNLERIKGEDDSEFPRRFGISACFDIDTPAGPIRLINQHLVSPHMAIVLLAEEPAHGVRFLKQSSVRRRNESALITAWMARHGGRFIVVGDFNMPPESPIFRDYWAEYPDAFTTAGWGYGFTHLTPLSELRIDHVLTTGGITCTGVRIGPSCGTPHRPLVADLVIPTEK